MIISLKITMAEISVSVILLILKLGIILGLGVVGGSVGDTVIAAEIEAGCETPVILHGYVSVRNRSFALGQQIEVKCKGGYRLPSTKLTVLHLVCQSQRTWTDLFGNTQLPTCERIGGCPLPVIVNGAVVHKAGDYMPEDVALLRCDEGYSLQPPHTYIICQVDGTWMSSQRSTRMPLCQLENCPLPKTLKHGRMDIMRDTTVNASMRRMTSPASISHGTHVFYQCNDGFQLDNNESAFSKCDYGQWTGIVPKCIKRPTHGSCPEPTAILNAYYYYTGKDPNSRETVLNGSMIQYVCNNDRYELYGDGSRVCLNGHWSGATPHCKFVAKSCSAPRSIMHGDYNFFGRNDETANLQIAEGSQVYYYCHSGYKMNVNISVMVCRDGIWHGQQPTCVKRTRCGAPLDIKNGNWVILGMFPDFRIGMKVLYECKDDFKSIGTMQLTCLATGYWSDYAPRCLPKGLYCSEPETIKHGFYMCKPSHCDLYKLGTEIHYMCDPGYAARPNDLLVQMCERGGHWTSTKPVCLPVVTTESGSGSINASTMTIVVATSCSVLGLLLIVLVIVALQRHMKPPGHACHHMISPPQLPPPPPYAEGCTNPTVDEHDRVALIAFADGAQIALPSYEEATRGRAARFGHASSSSNVSRGSSRSVRSDYRLLPTIPSNLYMAGGAAVPGGASGGADLHHPQHDHHRNSIITTASTTTRDNLSMAFGSIDTMNVSDGTSTTVTIGTYNSSNLSLAVSQHAASGSLGSSNGSLANEDAPLLDGDDTARNRHNTTSPSADTAPGSEEQKDV